MATTITAGNATNGAIISPDNTGILELKTGTGAGTTAVTIGTNQAVTFAGAVTSSGNQTVTGNLTVDGNTTLGNANTDTILMTAAPSIGGAGLGMGFGFRNRIINGDMRIDQRNAGASVGTGTGNTAYSLDRWAIAYSQTNRYTVQRNAGSVTPPAGFTNYLGLTSSSAYSITSTDFFFVRQFIEGFNVSDFAWGTANAQTITVSFWVRSSLTGTFGGAIRNGSVNRTYPFSYTISAANTWEQKTLTIPGDTTGTWATDNTTGLEIIWSVGSGSTLSGTAGSWSGSNLVSATGATSVVGTNGATFYITGVQLEKGSTATSFDYRPYTTELQLCQRYYYRQTPTGTAYYGTGFNDSTTASALFINFPVPMRVAPSAVDQSGTASNYRVQITGNVINCSAVPTLNFADLWGGMVIFTVASGLTAGQASMGRSNSTSGYLGFSAEL